MNGQLNKDNMMHDVKIIRDEEGLVIIFPDEYELDCEEFWVVAKEKKIFLVPHNDNAQTEEQAQKRVEELLYGRLQ